MTIQSIIGQTLTVGTTDAQFLVQDFAVIMIVAAVMLLIYAYKIARQII